MKDYELDKSKKGLFILNYQVKGDQIIVNYANEEAVTVPNTERNIEILDRSMREQVNNSSTCLDKMNGCVALFIILCFVGLVISTPVLCSLIFTSAEFTLKAQILLGLGIGISVGSLVGIIGGTKKINDIKKNKRFLEIENELNAKVTENENMLYKTHRITKNLVNTNKDNRVVFTINNIDKVPFSDLNQIMDNIQREDKFNFEYPEVIEEEKTKKKTK